MTVFDPVDLDAGPLGVNDVIELVTSATTIAAGHRLRAERCLACGCRIGELPARIVVTIDLRVPPCSCGSVASVSFLIHEQPYCTDRDDLQALALARWHSHHGGTP